MVTITHLVSSRSGNDQNLYVTPSAVTFSANRHALLAITGWVASGTSNEPIVTGGGVSTWTPYRTYVRGLSRLTIFYGLTGSSPTPSQLTFDFSGQTQDSCSWSVSEVDGAVMTGVNGVDAFVQYIDGQTGANINAFSLTLTNPFFGDNSLTVGAFSVGASRTTVATSPSVLLGSTNGAGNSTALATCYSATTTVAAEFTGTNSSWSAIAFELRGSGDTPEPIVQQSAFATRNFNGRLQ